MKLGRVRVSDATSIMVVVALVFTAFFAMWFGVARGLCLSVLVGGCFTGIVWLHDGIKSLMLRRKFYQN